MIMGLKEELEFSIRLYYLVGVGMIRLSVLLKSGNSLRGEAISYNMSRVYYITTGFHSIFQPLFSFRYQAFCRL